MNNTLFLTFSQVNIHCIKLQDLLSDPKTSHKDLIQCEQALWNEVKKVRALQDASIFSYLIGYYHTILFLTTTDDLFQYYLFIRLGDLNRYIERIDVAEYYYCNARNLYPFYGHAYNQLGLLTKSTDCFKCCYYYARAAKSTERPLTTIADSNLRIAISKYDCELLHHILNDEACISNGINPDEENIEQNADKNEKKLPETPFDWFYVMVVAVYADNVQPIARMFLNFLIENFSTQHATTTLQDGIKVRTVYCDQDSYMLLASLDVLLDWLKFCSPGPSRTICTNISAELKQIKKRILAIIASVKQDSNCSVGNSYTSVISPVASLQHQDTTKSSNSTYQELNHTNSFDASNSKNQSLPKLQALPHDHILRGFAPLEASHKELSFKATKLDQSISSDNNQTGSVSMTKQESSEKKFIESERLLQFMTRIRCKMETLGPLIKRRTRNIALESILSNMVSGCE